MKIILRSPANDFIKSISFKNLEYQSNFISELNSIKSPAKAQLIISNERITSCELAKFKLNLKKFNINLSEIYSNNRETILSGKFLKINSTLLDINENKNEQIFDQSFKEKDILHKGTVRSGDRISSNGDLIIIGDVHPGAIVSANKNVFVWGKLLGIAFAGENGNKNAFIASHYLNPLQLRICQIIAIGPKEKPKHQYPEVAILEEGKIIIRPYNSVDISNK